MPTRCMNEHESNSQVQIVLALIGITWTRPFRVETTDALKVGQNQLEITAVNSWQNRLVGDLAGRRSSAIRRPISPIRDDGKLLRSGLSGPAEIKRD